MSLKIEFSKTFLRQAKQLSKRHRSLKRDLKKLVEQLSESPEMGTIIAPELRKVRFAVTSKGKGKSGGARVITYYKELIEPESGERSLLLLVALYDKSDTATISLQDIRAIIAQSELREEE